MLEVAKERSLWIRLALVALVSTQLACDLGRSPAHNGAGGAATVSDDERIERAFAEQRGDLWVEVEGRVDRVLSDDLEGSRHQRFILELASGHTVLVAHNIDLAPRVPDLEVGFSLRIRGEYEWNPQGGVIHWTHHDPGGRREGGWIEHAGTRYR